MTMRDMLSQTLTLLTDPDHWTQHYNARTAANVPVYATSDHAVKFCVSGAIIHLFGDNKTSYRVLEYLDRSLQTYTPDMHAQPTGYDNVECFNDVVTHTEVLTFLRTARDKARR